MAFISYQISRLSWVSSVSAEMSWTNQHIDEDLAIPNHSYHYEFVFGRKPVSNLFRYKRQIDKSGFILAVLGFHYASLQ